MDEMSERLQAALPERYTLLRQIGRGGMATVYLASERHPRRHVAVKVLDPSVAVRLARERFLREIDFVSNLTHPHIVPIFAAGEAEGILFYVMPFVEGESLSRRIRRDGALAKTEALRIARDVAGALEYAHRRNVLHRDIKPENILLHDNYALVTDFGVARAVSAAGEEAITETGLTVGTAAYMSPEQAAGREDLDGRTDIYSLGCVLFEMLAGSPPFGTGPSQVILPRQITEPAPSLLERVPGVSPDLDVVLQRALAKNVEDRFDTAASFERELDLLRSSLTSGSGIRTAIAPRGRFARWVWPVVGLLGTVGVVALTWSLSTPRDLPMLAAAHPRLMDSVGVLPVENLTEVPALDRFADGVTHGAISALQKTPTLKTAAYFSVRSLDEGLGLSDVFDELGVRLLVASQLRVVGGQIELSAELVDRGNRLNERASWPVSPEHGLVMERRLVDRIVELVGRATGLAMALPSEEGADPSARDAFLLGEHWLGRRTPMGVRRALESFREAVAIDSTFAAAWQGMSRAYMLAVTYRYEVGLSAYQAAGNALVAAERAIALDPTSAEAYAARGFVVSRAFGSTAMAASDFDRALRLAPNQDQVVAWSGAVLAQEGRREEALAAGKRGVELGPLSPSRHMGVANTALVLRAYDDAAAAARRAFELEPELIEAQALRAFALLLSGRTAECLDLALGGHIGLRALCLHEVGRVAQGRALIDSLTRAVWEGRTDSVFTDVIPVGDIAAYHAYTGDQSEALTWIGRAYDLSPMGIEQRVLASAVFDRVRANRDGRTALNTITGRIWPRVEQHAERVKS